MVQPLWKTVLQFLRKLKVKLPYGPAITLVGIYLEKVLIQKGPCTLMFTAALFTIAKAWKQLQCPATDEWIKMRYVYIILLSQKNTQNEIMPFTWI